jgi:hypothetical protein
MRPWVPVLFSLVAISAVATTRAARAADALEITGAAELDGQVYVRTLTVKPGGALHVKAKSLGGLGYVSVHANEIVVEKGGVIDATGAGYAGVDAASGDGDGASGGLVGMMVGSPGGGGAYAGSGDMGRSSGCLPLGGAGGTAVANPMSLSLGGAGGAARLMNALAPSKGGAGGGRVELFAAHVRIDGEVRASGADGLAAVEGVGSGGGAGGVVHIVASAFDGAGSLRASGGRGGVGSASNGGGGGGGLVVLDALSTFTGAMDLKGGATGDCMQRGSDGYAPAPTPPAACVDVDGDGHGALSCGGDDCDDADPSIHPGALEACNNVDDDCDGAVDTPLASTACATGLVCRDGACASSEDGGPATDTGTRPDHLAYEGGCAASSGGSSRSACALGVALALVASVASGRRGRRGRRCRRR